MSDRQTLADLSLIVLSEISHMCDDVDDDTPHAYAFRKLKMAAEKAAENGLRSAAEFIETSRALKREFLP